MSDSRLHRRRFLLAAGAVGVSAGLAGCGDDGDSTGDVGDGEPADASVRIVSAAPSTDENGGGPAVIPDSGAQSDALEITEVTLQQAGAKGLVVAGNVENTSEQAFAEILAEATLFDGNPLEDSFFDSTTKQSHQNDIGPGELWQWAVTFRENPSFDIDHYAVTISAWYE